MAAAKRAKRDKPETITITDSPIDYDKLAKGTWIETAQLEAATLSKCTDPSYLVRVLGIRDKVEKKAGILARVDGLRLRLMTDSEALAYSIRAAKLASDKLERAAVHLHYRIDRRNLTEAEQKVHEHAERIVVAMADAQHAEKKKAARLFEFVPARAELEPGDG